ncbi:MAG: RsmB/NOP family class I SAM-dependent RNA methyltransferase [Candidatus Bathyarchaeota archaeon]
MSLSWTLAIEALSWIELERLNEDAAIRKTVKQLRIRDRVTVDAATELVYETVRRKNSIDYLINPSLDPDNIGNQTVGVRSFLRLFTYYAHYSEESLGTAYQLAQHAEDLLGKRNMGRIDEGMTLLPLASIPFDSLTDVQRLAYTHFHPVWYVDYLYNRFGINEAEDLLRYVDTPSYLRVNTLKAEPDAINTLMDMGFGLVKEPLLEDTYKVLDEDGLTDSQPYRDGHFIMQDKASVAVGAIVNPKPGEVVLDVCAAPGVKTSHMAQLMENQGRIISIDYNLRRLKSWESLMGKLGVTIAKPIHGDASSPDILTHIDADVVVVDPPCTGSGTFHKEPSGKWRLTPRSVDRMASLQRRIIENMSGYVRPGGTLVYSTCSVTLDENEGVVNWFLGRNPDFEVVDAEPLIGSPGLDGLDKAQRMYPHVHDCNGFFIAKLVKSL